MTWANLDWQSVLCCVPNQIGFNAKKKSSGDDNVFKEKRKNMRLESLT
jgi:hypothetical protein